MKLSIIVPCYNVQEYLLKCLTSLKNQDVCDGQYEVLVINDGSKDSTGRIAQNFCKDNPSIFHYFEHHNIGLSGTRNRGIREAKGDFIWFVDSDDWIEENCLNLIISMLYDSIDILAFKGFIPEGGRVENCQCYNNNVNSKESLFLNGFADAAQFYIFRTSFLLNNTLFFKEGIKHEDTLFTPIVLSKVNNIVFFRQAVYHFLQREGSITTVIDIKRVSDLADNLKCLYQFSNLLREECIKRGFLNHMAHHIIEMLNYGIDNGKKGEELIEQIMKQNPEFWNIMKNAIDLKPRLLYWIVKLSPLSFITTYRLLARLR